ncbi:MAG TPA: DEAD/DEAH box helicase, partial [Amycolatopsis sp.]
LRSAEDPSLLVPAEQIWNSPSGLRRWIEQPQELLLAELARASVIYPELAEALREARPSELELGLHGAYRFLSEVAGKLDQAGFGVLLPAWWSASSGPERRLGLAVTASSAPAEGAVTSGGLDKAKLARFDWRLAVGDDVLTEEEIAELVATKAPLVRLRGRWTAVDPERLRLGLEYLRAAPARVSTAAELLAVMTDPDSGPGARAPLPITSARVDGWLGDLLAGTAERTLRPVDPPADFAATLRPYQHRGLSWLAFLSSLGLGACLADDMGLGKTVQLIALHLHRRPLGAGPTLVLCPTSLLGNWEREFAKFAPGVPVRRFHGGGRHLDELAADEVVLATYGVLRRDRESLSEVEWGLVAADEAQHVKNPLSATAKELRKVPAAARVALTGTPVENRLTELWSLVDWTTPGLLGSLERFRRTVARPIERDRDPAATERLATTVRPFLLRRRKTDPDIAPELPRKTETDRFVPLTAEQTTLYEAVVRENLAQIRESQGVQRRGQVLKLLTELKQICNHPAQFLKENGGVLTGRSGKLAAFEELLEVILDEGDSVLVFSQYVQLCRLLERRLAERGLPTELLSGEVGPKRRDEMVARFQAGEVPVFLLSLKAGGVGLNLTRATHVIHYDRWWNPAVEDQATDRAYRIGQDRPVQVHRLIAEGTLEERIAAVLETKRGLADAVVGAGEDWITELSDDQIADLVRLGAG